MVERSADGCVYLAAEGSAAAGGSGETRLCRIHFLVHRAVLGHRERPPQPGRLPRHPDGM